MGATTATADLVDKGVLSFTIESRLLRELGERLVKAPEVAVVELIKNAYDADATRCEVSYRPESAIVVEDDGVGMTLERFKSGWMRIGTSSKVGTPASPRYGRRITGEKGIGRFAVRFLGRGLVLASVADDIELGYRTRLEATFDWPTFDNNADLGKVKVPYTLARESADTPTGTTLTISPIRDEAAELDLNQVRTASLGVLSPLRSLVEGLRDDVGAVATKSDDPGFLLAIAESETDAEFEDVAATVLDAYVLRARVTLRGDQLKVRVTGRERRKPYTSISERCVSELGDLAADIRFFPRRKGVFMDVGVDGRRAYTWIRENAGVAVFDRDFRVQPYGAPFDDWLQLAADTASNRREPRSTLAQRHFPMTADVRKDTAANWMLRLPQPAQLVGAVLVEGQREGVGLDDSFGLFASADREGFVVNSAFRQLRDIVRGAVEAIAEADRQLQLEQEEEERQSRLAELREETAAAITEIENNPRLRPSDRAQLVSAVSRTLELADEHDTHLRERERQMEVMSLLGTVAGFMTHEFGTALAELERAQRMLDTLKETDPRLARASEQLRQHVTKLAEFAKYSAGYIQAGREKPSKTYPVLPRIRQVIRVFGSYAADRGIDVAMTVATDLRAPLVPVSLYNGVALNLYSNALKAVTAYEGSDLKVIAFRAWNEKADHFLEVSDTGVGIPDALRERLFEPFFTTTRSADDPLGSGMGLGLTLVRRGVEAYGGEARVVDPPADFATCIQIRMPLDGGS